MKLPRWKYVARVALSSWKESHNNLCDAMAPLASYSLEHECGEHQAKDVTKRVASELERYRAALERIESGEHIVDHNGCGGECIRIARAALDGGGTARNAKP